MLKILSSASVIAVLATATAAFAQTPAPSAPAPTPPAATQPGNQPAVQNQTSAVTLTEDQAKNWVNKPVYGSDGKEIGEVAAFVRTPDNKVTELHADIGGFLGMGETRVKVMPSDFKLQGDRVVLNLTSDQAKTLPKVAK